MDTKKDRMILAANTKKFYEEITEENKERWEKDKQKEMEEREDMTYADREEVWEELKEQEDNNNFNI